MTSRRGWTLITAVATTVVLASAGCFNGSFHDYAKNYGGGQRFALVIEPDRTDIDATHYLLDTATGDVWTLGASGSWERMVDGPEDVRPLDEPDGDEDEERDGASEG